MDLCRKPTHEKVALSGSEGEKLGPKGVPKVEIPKSLTFIEKALALLYKLETLHGP